MKGNGRRKVTVVRASTVYMRIREAMVEHEKWVLEQIRKAEEEDGGVWTPQLAVRRILNAIERLERAGAIRYDAKRHGYRIDRRRVRRSK